MVEDNDVGFTLPVIGKSKSVSSGACQRGTMADIFGNLVSDEELLASQTPRNMKRNYSPLEVSENESKSTITSPNNTTSLGSDKGSEEDLSAIKRFPIPPESPLPSTSFDRGGRVRTFSATEQEVVSNISQMTSCLVIDAGLAKIKILSDISYLTANSVIQTGLSAGLAKRKSADMSNDCNIDVPRSMAVILATSVTSLALESALRNTDVLVSSCSCGDHATTGQQ